MKRMLALLTIGLTALLSACGGGGGSAGGPGSVPNAAAAGFWNGTFATNRAFHLLTFDDGEFWAFYSVANDPNQLGGVIFSQATVGGTTTTATLSGSGIEYFLEGANVSVTSSALSATMLAGSTTTGTFGGNGFSGVYDPAFTLGPSLAAVAGVYTGTGLINTAPRESMTLTFTATGLVSAIGTSGCTASGNAAARTADGNAYAFTLAFGGAPCVSGTATVNGSGYFDSGPKRLYVGANDSALANAFLFQGTKP